MILNDLLGLYFTSPTQTLKETILADLKAAANAGNEAAAFGERFISYLHSEVPTSIQSAPQQQQQAGSGAIAPALTPEEIDELSKKALAEVKAETPTSEAPKKKGRKPKKTAE